ncbi:MAG: thiolase family protein [Clostridiales Family XIII bacterium]|jgi:acetyl-CoA C-acetyltransferase|nr:thiolase family protein [Clostridiales Family XIII bacterium]
MRDVVIVGAARTPIGDFLGALKDVDPVKLSETAANAAIERSGAPLSEIKEVACGMVYKAGHKGNPARQVQIGVGLPVDGYAYTIDQQCASGMKAFELIAQSVSLGQTDVGMAVGAESMSQAAYILKGAREGFRMGDGPEPVDTMLNDGLVCAMMGYHMGITAENLAEEYGVAREEQDEWALLSHSRAVAAQDGGLFEDEIAPVTIESRKGVKTIDKDEHPRRDISAESLASLRPAFKKDGTVTAGNASGVNDAAAAIILADADKAEALGMKPLARVLSTANFGVEPRIMGIGPAYAVPLAIGKAGLKPDDIAYYEINEAFAAQFLACNRILELDRDKVNARGSGIGLGHPVGCTGIRIIISLVNELKRRDERYGVASLCVGGGPAMAVVVENIT